MEVQVTMELWWTLNCVSMACMVYIGTQALKLICKAVHYINLVSKNENQ